MLALRPSQERGHANHGWLDTYHTFSFADYFDPNHMGFSALRVINEDRVAGGTGFGFHPHQDMEIITYVLSGALQHQDSMGFTSVIRPGMVQRMSAGSGVMHSEVNPSPDEAVHLLQIWIQPNQKGVAPRYDEKDFSAALRPGQLVLVASRDGRDGSLHIYQDADLYVALPESDRPLVLSLQGGRKAFVQVARGQVSVNGHRLQAGDGLGVMEESELKLEGEGEALVFDLP